MVLHSMRRRGHRIASVFVAGALVLPAAAWGQSAGDDQYQDPFGGQDSGEQAPEADEPEAAPAPAAPEPAPAAPTSTTAQAPNGEPQLPRTGADEGLVALAGGVLLASGLALRRRTSRPSGRA
jgi:LPXTG-motif cell wall-anchored protein